MNLVECKCNGCGKSFTRKKSEIKSKTVYCSRDCYLSNINKRARKRVPKKRYSCFCYGKDFYNWESQMIGKTHYYCSRPCANKHQALLRTGSGHPRWNPSLSEEDRLVNRKYPEYLKWRADVYERDSYTCQCCGDSKFGNLVAHHVLNYSEHPDLQTDLNNGITLCSVCHKAFHDKYGYTKNNGTQLAEFIDLAKSTPSQVS
ncbi:HNH endonuclease [Bacillus sp. CX-1]